MADLTCGEGGSTGAEVTARINENTHNIGDVVTLLTDDKSSTVGAINELHGELGDLPTLTTVAKDNLVNAINELDGEVGDLSTLTTTAKGNLVAAINELVVKPAKGSMRLQGDLTQTIGDVYETLECFNAVSSERGDVIVTVGLVGSIQYTGTVAVEAEVQYGINADFGSNEELEIIPYLNGVEYSDDPLFLRGLGAGKPVSFFWISQVTLQPNDTIALMARSSITATLDVTFQRSNLALKIDG